MSKGGERGFRGPTLVGPIRKMALEMSVQTETVKFNKKESDDIFFFLLSFFSARQRVYKQNGTEER